MRILAASSKLGWDLTVTRMLPECSQPLTILLQFNTVHVLELALSS